MTNDKAPEDGLRAALRPIVADWFDTGYEAGNLSADVLTDRVIAALAATPADEPIDEERLVDAIQSAYDEQDDHRQRHPGHGGACQDDWPQASRLAHLTAAAYGLLATAGTRNSVALDVGRLARAMRWAGVVSEGPFVTVEEAARQVARDYIALAKDWEGRAIPVPAEVKTQFAAGPDGPHVVFSAQREQDKE